MRKNIIKFEYRITLYYLFFGLLWIFFSDSFFDTIIIDKHLLSQFQTIKGFFFVFITGFLLFGFIKRHFYKLEIANEKAKESERLKNAFLCNISHEVRTPMNSIIGFSKILYEEEIESEEQKKYLKLIETSSERLLYLITNLVEISKIESGIIKPNYSELSLDDLLEELYFKYYSVANINNINFEFVRTTIPLSKIKTDFDKLFAIINNLLNNAFKYTQKGKIEFGYNIKSDNIEFFVKDTGIGIPKIRQEEIFKPFIQSDIEDRNATQGIGLGLSVSISFIECLKGKIWLESKENFGSTFYFTIPLIRA